MILSIVGNGMMAKSASVLSSDWPTTIFASGVSNSAETAQSSYQREIDLLQKAISDTSLFVYFSSYLAEDGNSVYAEHKRHIEELIKQETSNYIILRLPQVVGIASNNTLINYFVRAIVRKEYLALQKYAYRSLIDVEDVMRVLQTLIDKRLSNITISVGPSRPMKVTDIFKVIEEIVGGETSYEELETGTHQRADLTKLIQILGKNDPLFADGYQRCVLEKYALKLLHLNQINIQP